MMNITVLGLSITSSWGNGHATTYRGLVKALCRRGHSVLFLERDMPWYAANRDLSLPPFGQTCLYQSIEELQDRFAEEIRSSDLVIVGSYVPDGVAVGKWVCAEASGVAAFYDIDTPVTLAKIENRDYEYLTPELISTYDLYLSFTGGPVLQRLEQAYGSPLARPLYCSVDPDLYFPEETESTYDLGYLGTYSDDRQPPLQRMMLDAADRWPGGRFVVAGPQYPEHIRWPANVERIEHLPPAEHRRFYNAQRFTLNVTRQDMIRAGYAPSVRLFEAAACGIPIISDWWNGLDEFFQPANELLTSSNASETLAHLKGLSERERRKIGEAAKAVVLNEHTADRRAEQLEASFEKAHSAKRRTEATARVRRKNRSLSGTALAAGPRSTEDERSLVHVRQMIITNEDS